MERHVWNFAEAEVEVYREIPSLADPSVGEIVGEVVTPYCYMEGGTLVCATALVRRSVTGRGRRKLVSPANAFDEITLTVNHLYFRKAAEFDHLVIFSPKQQLRLILKNVDWLYSNDFPFENDTFTISFAFAQSFQVTGQRADVMEGTATFQGEVLI